MSSSIDELGEKLEKLKMENELATQEAEIAQKKAIKKDLESKYGKSWRSLLKLKDDQSLKQFASGRIKLV